MPSLIDRITAIFRKAQPPEQTTTATETLPARRPGQMTALIAKFQAETGRKAVVERCREMYAQDPRAKRMHRMLAQDLVRGGFTIQCEDQQAVDVAEALRKRLSLDQRLDDWVRLSARDGDSFLELSINDRLEVVEISRKPSLQMHRNSDSRDRFEDPARAYWWADDAYIATEPPQDAIWFADWQIIHARWDHDEGSRYGMPMMASSTGHYKKVQEGELDIAVRRKTRAGLRWIHQFPEGTNQTEIEQYKEINKDILDDPLAAVADIFTTAEVTAQQGDATLGEISDVRHMIATWLAGGEVPMELFVYGEDLNRDVLGVKTEQYNANLAQGREWVTAHLLRPLLETQWLLAGIYPANLDYKIEWRTKKEPTPADLQALANAVMTLRIMGYSDEVVAKILAYYVPDLEPEDLVTEEPEADADSADRIGRVLGGVGGGL